MFEPAACSLQCFVSLAVLHGHCLLVRCCAVHALDVFRCIAFVHVYLPSKELRRVCGVLMSCLSRWFLCVVIGVFRLTGDLLAELSVLCFVFAAW